jgi:MoxR-like ATPase
MSKITPEVKSRFLAAITKKYGPCAVLKNQQILQFAEDNGFPRPNWIFTNDNKMGTGKYRLPAISGSVSTVPAVTEAEVADVSPALAAEVIQMRRDTPTQKFDPNAVSDHEYAKIPERDQHYVAFGEFADIQQIIKSGMFFPVFISGLSGNGKTFMVEQAASRAKRPMIRVQMSRETDEDDLIGGFRLINGETKFLKGPVLRAMELGALLLIDEADRADPGKIMCLQGILEGKNYYVKKTGEIISPQPGFNIIVTANTKGRGSDDGRYIAAAVLDDAWLERFPITIEQSYPVASTEKKILTNYLCDDRTCTDEDHKFIEYLTSWAEVIRKTFAEVAIDEVISTRRLVQIAQTYKIFNDRMRSIRLCINRFDEETKTAFLDLYAKVDPTLAPPAPATPEQTPPAADATQSADPIPF